VSSKLRQFLSNWPTGTEATLPLHLTAEKSLSKTLWFEKLKKMIMPEITVLVKLVEVCNYKNSILIIEQNTALKKLLSGSFMQTVMHSIMRGFI
jgi:hypothetical protein